uniref:Uncharacterized protein n=1 Tax=Anopheles maculatus TaxID=74869 RepID=A0A182SKA1_9DIPT
MIRSFRTDYPFIAQHLSAPACVSLTLIRSLIRITTSYNVLQNDLYIFDRCTKNPTSLIGQVSQGFPWPTIITTTVGNVGQSLLQQGVTSAPPREEEVSTVPQWLEAQLAQQILPERSQDSFVLSTAPHNARPVVVDGAGNQNLGTAFGIGQLPLASPVYDTSTTTGRAVTTTTDNGVCQVAIRGGWHKLMLMFETMLRKRFIYVEQHAMTGCDFNEAPPPVVVNRFGDDGSNGRPSSAPVPAVPVLPQTTTTTTTQRPTTTTVRQTRPVTRQTTTRNTQRTTTRFITRVPQTPPPPPTTPRTTTTTRTSTILQQRPPLPPQQPSPAQQQPILPAQAPPQPQPYPTIIYERPQAPPRVSPPPPPPPPQQYPTIVYERPQAPPRVSPPPTARPFYVPPEPPRTPPTQYGQTTPDSIIDHFFVPPSQAASLPPSPIVGLWNQLGTKIADTADAIAGMLQKTVDVLVTSHIQSHQRALRRS